MATATFVLYGQEILGLDAARFGLLTTGFAVGGVIGSFAGSRVIKSLGQGGTLLFAVVSIAGSTAISGLTSSFWLFWAMGLIGAGTGTLWNVVTVSLRQSLIPDRILGRVNSVYRFIGWGMIPVGSLLGGIVVAVVEPLLGREWALRSPFLIAALGSLALFAFVASRLSTQRIEEAKAAAAV
jgi:MFS family permease